MVQLSKNCDLKSSRAILHSQIERGMSAEILEAQGSWKRGNFGARDFWKFWGAEIMEAREFWERGLWDPGYME